MIIIYVQFALFFTYIFFVMRKYGVQKSISDSWYVVDKPNKWMFTIVFCWGLGLSQALHGTVWFFMSGVFLCFVGAAMDFKGWSVTNLVHYAGAVGCIVLGLIGLAVTGIWWPFVPVAVAAVTLSKVKNGTWWIEFVAFFSILGGLINKYL